MKCSKLMLNNRGGGVIMPIMPLVNPFFYSNAKFFKHIVGDDLGMFKIVHQRVNRSRIQKSEVQKILK